MRRASILQQLAARGQNKGLLTLAMAATAIRTATKAETKTGKLPECDSAARQVEMQRRSAPRCRDLILIDAQ